MSTNRPGRPLRAALYFAALHRACFAYLGLAGDDRSRVILGGSLADIAGGDGVGRSRPSGVGFASL